MWAALTWKTYSSKTSLLKIQNLDHKYKTIGTEFPKKTNGAQSSIDRSYISLKDISSRTWHLAKRPWKDSHDLRPMKSPHTCIILLLKPLLETLLILNPTPLFEECEDDIHTPEMGTWESSETFKTSELDCRGQNTSPWAVLHVIGKLLKCRCRKWPHMIHLNIYSTSYGKKKGRESNCQFNSWPLKSRESTRPRCVQVECDTPLEISQRELQVCCRPHLNQRYEQRVMNSQSPGSPNRDNFETPPWESWDKKPFGCRCHGVTQRILYGGRWWLPPSLGRGESCESRVVRGLS